MLAHKYFHCFVLISLFCYEKNTHILIFVLLSLYHIIIKPLCVILQYIYLLGKLNLKYMIPI